MRLRAARLGASSATSKDNPCAGFDLSERDMLEVSVRHERRTRLVCSLGVGRCFSFGVTLGAVRSPNSPGFFALNFRENQDYLGRFIATPVIANRHCKAVRTVLVE